jgi:hypothetical protein
VARGRVTRKRSIKRSGKRSGGYHGFKSKAQWRWAFANKMRWARGKARKTAGGKIVRYRRLPWRKSAKKGARRL